MKLWVRISAGVAALALMTSSGALAQPFNQSQNVSPRAVVQQQDGVTVSAFGVATGQATSALFNLNISTRSNDQSITAADLQPIVDALVASGVERSSIHTPPYLQPPSARTNYAMISGTATAPTLAKLQQGMINVSNVFTSSSKLVIANAQVTLRIDDCSSVADASRTDAIHRAHARALATARDLGVKLGAVLSANVSAPVDATGSCSTTYQLPYNQPSQESDPFTVRVMTPVTVRYAIR